ncbi:hypothetical protein [Fervidibacillus halotolerans]|uniref:Antitoxin n=1 Tax=Fervidibacillus halotolerans TaxID=2980027 RepID=A0A9E8M206_9BACI|nr:hypothetical protein [Fervidibacillus halotolerans]WAA12819.1 hypothetical protein OE105_01355 [Fervidibacillus halotolerans]
MGDHTLTNEKYPKADTNTLDFLKKNVFNVTEISRTKKLSEILDRFSNGVSDEIFVIQNAKKKDALAVIIDLDYFKQLLQIKEVVESALDRIVMEDAQARKDKPANQTLSDVFDEEDINVDELMKLLKKD